MTSDELQAAENWLDRGNEKQPRPTELQREYIRASRYASDRARKLTIMFLTFGLLLALGLAAWALVERSQAITQANIATARYLASKAEVLRTQPASQLPQSVLLAIESMQRLPSSEADRPLHLGLELLRRPVKVLPFKGWVGAVAYSQNSKYLASGGEDGSVSIWETSAWKMGLSMKHDKPVRGVTFSPDGYHLASASEDKTVRIWDLRTGRELARLAHDGAVLAIAYSPDGNSIATASADKTARIWAPGDHHVIRRFVHQGAVTAWHSTATEYTWRPQAKIIRGVSGRRRAGRKSLK